MRFVVAIGVVLDPCVLGARVLILRERGVTVVRAPNDAAPSFRGEGCAFVIAEVWRGGGHVMVWVTDPDGRRVERQADDAAAAATP